MPVEQFPSNYSDVLHVTKASATTDLASVYVVSMHYPHLPLDDLSVHGQLDSPGEIVGLGMEYMLLRERSVLEPFSGFHVFFDEGANEVRSLLGGFLETRVMDLSIEEKAEFLKINDVVSPYAKHNNVRTLR